MKELDIFHIAHKRAAQTREAVDNLIKNPEPRKRVRASTAPLSTQIHQALSGVSLSLAGSYAQVKSDLQDTDRTSWAGTAHEIREILRGILELLAPDTELTTQPGFQLEKGATSPTQKQKVVHILRKHNAGSKEEEVAKQAIFIEDRVGNLVRAMYSRASNAAHTSRDRKEVIRILNYFEAVAHDLLNID